MAKTILGIGAHYDDCVFGIPGILLKAVRKNHRVVILTLISDYTNWKPAEGREREIVDGTVQICKEYGTEMRFLNFAGIKYDVTEASKRAVAEAVAEIEPDVALTLWQHDNHTDHEVASQLSKVALRHGDRLLPKGRRFKHPSEIYHYDNGPRHTIGFEPNTFVDVSDEWPKRSSGSAGSWRSFARRNTTLPSETARSEPRKPSPSTEAKRAAFNMPRHSARRTP